MESWKDAYSVIPRVFFFFFTWTENIEDINVIFTETKLGFLYEAVYNAAKNVCETGVLLFYLYL